MALDLERPIPCPAGVFESALARVGHRSALRPHQVDLGDRGPAVRERRVVADLLELDNRLLSRFLQSLERGLIDQVSEQMVL